MGFEYVVKGDEGDEFNLVLSSDEDDLVCFDLAYIEGDGEEHCFTLNLREIAQLHQRLGQILRTENE